MTPRTNQVIAMLELLRHLAGRLPDDQLAELRRELAAGQLDELEWTVLYRLRDNDIRLSQEEVGLLPMIGLEPDDFPVEPPGAPRPAYRFTPCAGSADDNRLVATAEPIPTLRRVVKARRVPDNTAAIQPDKPIYVVTVSAAGDLPQLQAGLNRATGGALLEVVAEGEKLPPYQAAALAAGHQIWPAR